MSWESLLLKHVSKTIKNLTFTKQLMKIFLWIIQEGRQGPMMRHDIYGINQTWLLSCQLLQGLDSLPF